MHSATGSIGTREENVELVVALGMFDIPYFSYNQIEDHLDISYQQDYRAVNQLEPEGVIVEVTDDRGDGVSCAHGVLDILGEAPNLNIRM